MPETSLTFLDALRARDNDELWARLVRLYQPMLRAWLRSQADLSESDADDLIQEVLLAVAQDLGEFTHSGNPGAFRCWLRRILANRLRELWRRRQKEPQAVGGSDFLKRLAELQDDASGISAAWDRDHDRHVMHHLMEDLQPRFAPQTWQAFRMQVVEGLPPATVAERLNLSANSVYVAKSRVLQALRQAAAGLIT